MGKFAPGTSGNPRGRPPRADKEKALRTRIMKVAPAVIDNLIAAAEAGDVTAGKTLLSYVLAPYRPVDRPAELPLPDGPPTLEGAAAAVLNGLASGSLTPDEASRAANVVVACARVQETAELEARLAAIEELLLNAQQAKSTD